LDRSDDGLQTEVLMPLQSPSFRGDPQLEAAAVSDPAHIVPGATGPHVRKIQRALIKLDQAPIARDDLQHQRYGPSTAQAVLAYKTKRRIINHSYQSQADDIVGKMTIAALDRELLAADGRNAAPAIVAAWPLARPVDRRPEAVRPHIVRVAFSINFPAPGQTPTIDPGGGTSQMEIEVNQIGTFRVINGGGETLFCRDGDIATVFDPAQPGGQNNEWVTKDPQTFQVRGLKPGATKIEVTKTNSLGIISGTVSLDLIVDPPSLKSLWNCAITTKFDGGMRYNPWMDAQLGDCTTVESARFEIDGTVNPVSSIAASDFEIGFMQALIQSKMTAVYVDPTGRPAFEFEIGERQLPLRDSDKGVKPWMKNGTFKALDAPDGKKVHAEDRPRNIVPWLARDDKQAKLKSATGSDIFVTWLVARQKSTGSITALCWRVWNVDWTSSFDFATKKGTSTGSGSTLGATGDGNGPMAPLTGDPTANDSITLTWRKL
jgi:peptidoglycan hydrolase-like protein with peptidoglycan-binding domain